VHRIIPNTYPKRKENDAAMQLFAALSYVWRNPDALEIKQKRGRRVPCRIGLDKITIRIKRKLDNSWTATTQNAVFIEMEKKYRKGKQGPSTSKVYKHFRQFKTDNNLITWLYDKEWNVQAYYPIAECSITPLQKSSHTDMQTIQEIEILLDDYEVEYTYDAEIAVNYENTEDWAKWSPYNILTSKVAGDEHYYDSEWEWINPKTGKEEVGAEIPGWCSNLRPGITQCIGWRKKDSEKHEDGNAQSMQLALYSKQDRNTNELRLGRDWFSRNDKPRLKDLCDMNFLETYSDKVAPVVFDHKKIEKRVGEWIGKEICSQEDAADFLDWLPSAKWSEEIQNKLFTLCESKVPPYRIRNQLGEKMKLERSEEDPSKIFLIVPPALAQYDYDYKDTYHTHDALLFVLWSLLHCWRKEIEWRIVVYLISSGGNAVKRKRVMHNGSFLVPLKVVSQLPRPP
jgi:hypothetical protein